MLRGAPTASVGLAAGDERTLSLQVECPRKIAQHCFRLQPTLARCGQSPFDGRMLRLLARRLPAAVGAWDDDIPDPGRGVFDIAAHVFFGVGHAPFYLY